MRESERKAVWWIQGSLILYTGVSQESKAGHLVKFGLICASEWNMTYIHQTACFMELHSVENYFSQ